MRTLQSAQSFKHVVWNALTITDTYADINYPISAKKQSGDQSYHKSAVP